MREVGLQIHSTDKETEESEMASDLSVVTQPARGTEL